MRSSLESTLNFNFGNSPISLEWKDNGEKCVLLALVLLYIFMFYAREVVFFISAVKSKWKIIFRAVPYTLVGPFLSTFL